MFTIPVALGAPVIYVLTVGHGQSVLVPMLGIVALTLAMGALNAWLA